MNKRVLILTHLLFLTLAICAQRGYKPGYIIKLNGDSLRGMIADGVETDGETNSQKIYFKVNGAEAEKFSAKDLKEYRKDSFPMIRAMYNSNGKKHFAYVLEDGPVILYKCFRVIGYGGTTYVDFDGGISIRPARNVNIDYYVQRKNDERSSVHAARGMFKTLMAKFFSDDPEIKKGIEEKTILLEHLQQTVQEYNKKHK